MPQAIHISPIDNVVVALHPIAKGTLVEVDGLAVTALEDIPQGHKMAVKPIRNGENVIKYGFPIGHATADAEPGTWMHTHNVHTNLSGEVEYSYNPAPDLAPLPKVEPETFMGLPPQGWPCRHPQRDLDHSHGRLCQRHRQEDRGRQSGSRHRFHRGSVHLHPSFWLQPDRA